MCTTQLDPRLGKVDAGRVDRPLALVRLKACAKAARQRPSGPSISELGVVRPNDSSGQDREAGMRFGGCCERFTAWALGSGRQRLCVQDNVCAFVVSCEVFSGSHVCESLYALGGS